MLATTADINVWCTRHRRDVSIADPRLHVIDLDLQADFDLESLPAPIDLVVHVAAVTHSSRPERYWEVNLRGTQRLAEAVRARGCGRFAYISTRCATAGAGAYGESKLAAECALKNLSWQRLLIVRPSEVYGAGLEGIDRFMEWGRRLHMVPLLFGDANIRFAPLHIDDFVALAAEALTADEDGSIILELCGPEDLTGAQLAWRIATRCGALPIPIYWPAIAFLLNAALRLGVHPVAPDQLQRLTCVKTCSATRASRTGSLRL